MKYTIQLSTVHLQLSKSCFKLTTKHNLFKD